jgi:hypothetical protein
MQDDCDNGENDEYYFRDGVVNRVANLELLQRCIHNMNSDRPNKQWFLGRTKEKQQQYMDYRKEVCNTWISMKDNLMCHNQWALPKWCPEKNRWKADEDTIMERSEILKGHDIRFKFEHNRFPYALTPNILHYLLWDDTYTFESPPTDEDVSLVVDFIANLLKISTNRILFLINKAAVRTVPEIFHIHFFIVGG